MFKTYFYKAQELGVLISLQSTVITHYIGQNTGLQYKLYELYDLYDNIILTI